MATPFVLDSDRLGTYYNCPLSLLDDYIEFREDQRRERGREDFQPRIEELKDVRAGRLLGHFFP